MRLRGRGKNRYGSKRSSVELAKTIHTTRPHLPVILVTGYGTREVLNDIGGAQILQKPYSEDELTEKITRALN
jgi:DNA-binding LytR/AlgR family response regulator